MKRQALIEEKLIHTLMELDEIKALLEDAIVYDYDINTPEAAFAGALVNLVESAGLKLSLAYENILTRYSKELP